jgi:hypothetical protein
MTVEVNKALRLGWKVHGSPFVYGGQINQALVSCPEPEAGSQSNWQRAKKPGRGFDPFDDADEVSRRRSYRGDRRNMVPPPELEEESEVPEASPAVPYSPPPAQRPSVPQPPGGWSMRERLLNRVRA